MESLFTDSMMEIQKDIDRGSKKAQKNCGNKQKRAASKTSSLLTAEYRND